MKLPKRGRREQELAREIQDHLDLEAEERRAVGLEPQSAAYAAKKAFGNTALVKEDVRVIWGWTRLQSFLQDLRFSFRMLAKNPGFSTITILTLALGIGANTAIFTVVNGLLLKPLPYRDPERLVVPATIFQRYNNDRGSVSYPDVQDWKSETALFEAVAVFNQSFFDVTSGDQPERIRALTVDEDYFRVMGTPPQIGRTFTEEENSTGANAVVLLSYSLWMRRFGGDPNVLQTSIELGGVPHKVVGVMPKDSTWPEEAELFKPLGFGRTPPQWTQRRDNHVFRAVARLKPGVNVEQAQAKLTALGTRVAETNSNRAGTNWKLHRMKDFVIGPALTRTLWVLLGAVFVVLLIACVNVANLLLARAAARDREVAIRKALGAGRSRLATQFMIESAVLALCGGSAGILLGYLGAKALVIFAPEGVPRLPNAHLDLAVLAFTIGLCLLTTVVFGLVPIMNNARRSTSESIREGGRSSSDGVRTSRMRGLLVVSELALAVVLLAGAGLLIRSFILLQRVDPGFPANNLLTLQISLPTSRYSGAPQVKAGFERIADAVRRVPGVDSAAAASSLPLGGGGFYLGRVFLTQGQPEPPASRDAAAMWCVIQPDYLQTVGLRLIAGRWFGPNDTKESTPVMIVNQAMAKQMFPNENPIGRRVRSWRDENVYREIVGVVADLRSSLSENFANSVYVPHTQDSWRALMMTIRTDRDPNGLLPSIRSAIAGEDAKLAISEVKTMEKILDEQLARPRFSMFLLVVFAATAIIMAAVGIYGLIAYAVAQRTREIGIRMALGAVRFDILRSVTGRALLLTMAGIALGTVGALGVTRLMASLLYGVSPNDAATLAGACLLLLFVALAASYIPARRASKVDPVVALRYE